MTDINYTQAAEDARGLARQFKAVLSLVDVLDELGKIEQTRKELEKSADVARRAAAAADAATRVAYDNLAIAKKAFAEATEAAEARKAEATTAADTIIAEANQKANQLVQAALDKVRSKDKQLASLAKEELELNANLDRLRMAIAEAEATLAEVRGKLASFLQ